MHFVHFELSQDRAEILRIPILFVSSHLPRNISCIVLIAMLSADLQRASPCTHVPAQQVSAVPRACSFLPSLQAQYQHGLALCQEAAEVQDAAFPEADPFQAAAALFRTKLMSFYRQVERRQAEQELLRELGQFSSKVGAWALLLQDPVLAGQP